eukprot:Nitzschia sp. Nitz4//scaffold254_size28068//599//5528//NITZ4_008147-RA/size28068-augustus-gene-0.31-mRNA-1//-1//CDS//3329544319//3233//frame0
MSSNQRRSTITTTTTTTTTNPFDDDYQEQEQQQEQEDHNDNDEELFHDAQQQIMDEPVVLVATTTPATTTTTTTTTKRRLAPLHFPSFQNNTHYQEQQEEHPALQFDRYGHARKVSNEFFSPLESVMMQMGGTLPPSPTKQATSISGIGIRGAIGAVDDGGSGGAAAAAAVVVPSYSALSPTIQPTCSSGSPERKERWMTEQSPLLVRNGGAADRADGTGGISHKKYSVPSEIRTGPSMDDDNVDDDVDDDEISNDDSTTQRRQRHDRRSHHHHHHGRYHHQTASTTTISTTTTTTTTPAPKNPILQELSGGLGNGHVHPGSNTATTTTTPTPTTLAPDPSDLINMEYKFILLEDLGTASSWLILLLPYCAFFLSLLWESATSLRLTTTGPLGPTHQMCTRSSTSNGSSSNVTTGTTTTTSGQVLVPWMTNGGSNGMVGWIQEDVPLPCWTPIPLDVNGTSVGGTDTGTDTDTARDKEDEEDASSILGTVFASGSISAIPILSTYLYGDAYFTNLTQATVDMVSDGWIQSSVVVFQEEQGFVHENDDNVAGNDWSVMFYSPPQTISMTCERNTVVTMDSNVNVNVNANPWNCQAPRLVDVVFSMPDAAVYTGGNLRIHVYYYYDAAPIRSPSSTRTSKTSSGGTGTPTTIASLSSSSSERSYDLHANETQVLQELVTSSSFLLEHMSQSASHVGTVIRVLTFLITFWFFLYWCHVMGVDQRCCFCGTRENVALWWESPWILFPERCYIVLLMLSLMLMQQPVLALVSIVPSLRPSTRLHIVADATVGIGAQGVLFVYLCLFHGFRFHTAAIAKKRAEHQRKMLDLRRAVLYVTKAQNPTSPTEAAISKYTQDYFEEHGDVDGSTSTSLLRLPNDPFADGWADFLLLKILLLLVGVISTIGTAYYRDPIGENKLDDFLNGDILRFKRVYIACISIEFATLVAWMWLILVAAFESGNKLRLEPFLGTRPVQLSFRILMAHLFLGFAVFSSSFAMNIRRLIHKWQVDTSPNDSGISDLSAAELATRVLSSVSQQFPYSGTTASAGLGNILFATVTVLITAFIFLPAHTLEEDDDAAQGANSKGGLKSKLNEQRRLRRDKRLVVNLVRDSRTWRVLPLPIKQITVTTSILRDNAIQLFSDMTVDEKTQGRGVVSVGPYTPVFCLEIACWLNEASWQAYYSPEGIIPRDPTITAMNLEGLGMHLEGAVYDEATDTQAYVATNFRPQVDGDKDSVIVVAFRGSASTTNLQTDLKSGQVPLLDQLVGTGSTPFNIHPNRVEIDDDDGWIWDTPTGRDESLLQCVTPGGGACLSSCIPGQPTRDPSEHFRSGSMTFEARKILQATPIARGSFPLVHEGFQEAYTQVRQKLLEVLLPVIQRQLSKCVSKGQGTKGRVPLVLPKIYCTGHSLGGSLAQLLALDLANNCELVLPLRPGQKAFLDSLDIESWGEGVAANELRLQPPIAVYTFGQPRVGNRTFSRLYKQRVPHTFRVVNEGDAITSLPNYLFCGGIYKHAGLEVLLDEGMTGNILVGPTVVETLFRFHKVRTSVLAHTMQRYRDSLECAFAQDELLEYFQGHNVVNHTSSRTTKQIRKRISTTPSTDIPDWMTQMRTSTPTAMTASTPMYY